MPNPKLLFVYGTLRPGGSAPIAARAGLSHVGPARARGRLYLVADYPALIADPAGEAVTGDLFAIADEATLAAIDAYEECGPDDPPPHEYARKTIMVETDTGPVIAWTYLYARDTSGLERIAGGDFLSRRS